MVWKDWYMTVGMVVVFLLLLLGFFFLLRSMAMIDAAKRNMERIMKELHTRDDIRVSQAEMERRRYGTTSGSGKKQGFITRMLNHLDDTLVYSEIMIKFTWLNASIYVILTIIGAAVAFLLGYMINGLSLGILLTCIVVFLTYIVLSKIATNSYMMTEKQIGFFINLIATNSIASADLVSVLDRVSSRVTNPIRGAIERAIASVQLSGNNDEAIWKLTREIEYPLFKEFIRNLDICGRNDADYRAVAKDFSKQAEVSLRAIEKQRAIFANARNEVILMIGVGVLLSFMTASFCDTSLITVLVEMKESLFGIVCLCVEFLIYLSALLYVLIGKRR